MWLQGSPDLLFHRSSSEPSPHPTLLRCCDETGRISKVGYFWHVKIIKGKENTQRSGERNIRTTAKRAGREQVVCSRPDASLFLHIYLSHALTSASDGPSAGDGTKMQILGLMYITMYLSAISLFSKTNNLHGLRSAFHPIRAKNLWLALSAQFPWSYKLRKLCSSWTHTASFSHLLHSLAMLEGTYFSSPSFFLSFCWAFYLTGAVKWKH